MLDAGLVRALRNLNNKTWADEDIKRDIDTLQEVLRVNLEQMSTFELYKAEVLSGELEWGPAHTSEKFWRENAMKLTEDNNKLLGVLNTLINTSPDPTVLAVACYDLGEFSRFHPQGKSIISSINAKVGLMKLMLHEDQQIQKHALLAIQKILV